ncbi:aspartate/glutamate racemase family protein [Thalassotalea mangrovi]|uniref:Aspartate/glutamate racemase family protein n=1 Tax=Thalassotalea mangrovi TaxID=2572245 RepID=A0A4U1B3P0_9GAMM|nr:aspartate/glutamate racemase family protein [Thalassotalea mangrovi]TKB44401.1 aspartate/glutamate racemase family protein [Thalassotalea mangrovi]
MKTIGLIGGMSWESTRSYYENINRLVNQRLGGYHSAKIVMVSVDFAEIEQLQRQGDWDMAGKLLADCAKMLELAGADVLLICTNTMHCVAEQVQTSVSIPLLHIADVTGEYLQKLEHSKAGLLGTRFTMEQDFYRQRVMDNYAIELLIPEPQDMQRVHDIIYQELVHGKIHEQSRQEYLKIINKLAANGAQSVVLGCTEIGLLVKQGDCELPLLDTTQLHCQAAVDYVCLWG